MDFSNFAKRRVIVRYVEKRGGFEFRGQLTARDAVCISRASERVANVPFDFYGHVNSLRDSRAIERSAIEARSSEPRCRNAPRFGFALTRRAYSRGKLSSNPVTL